MSDKHSQWSDSGPIKIYELNLYYFRDIFDWPIPKKSHFLVFTTLNLVKAKKGQFCFDFNKMCTTWKRCWHIKSNWLHSLFTREGIASLSWNLMQMCNPFQQPKKQTFLPQCTTIAYLHRPQKQFFIYLWPSCSFYHIKYKYIPHNFLQKNNAAVAFRLHHSFKCSSCVLLSNCSNEMSMLTKSSCF